MRAVLLAPLSLLILLTSCGSLTESECLATNWEQMGLEDGQNGRDSSQFDQYAEGCGKHSIQADMGAYQEGREQGLREFCQSENGFEAGKNGYEYLGICPSDLAGSFLAEYNIGVRFYYVYQEISKLESAVSSNADTIDKLNRGIGSSTFRLVNETDLSIREQLELQQNIRSMEDQIQIYEQDTVRLQSLLSQFQKGLQDLKTIYHK